ncbi:hypothetical protein C5167_015730, partial [Papaver somniferum]
MKVGNPKRNICFTVALQFLDFTCSNCLLGRTQNLSSFSWKVTSLVVSHYEHKRISQMEGSQLQGLNNLVMVCSYYVAKVPLTSPHYKVVCIWRNEIDNFVIEIYCSRKASWRLSGNPVAAAPYDVFYKPGVFWNGSLHWMSTNCDSSNLSESSVYFDVDREQLRRMPVPPAPEKWYRRVIEYFGECKGKLHVIQNYLPSTTTSLDVLEMDIDYRCWMLKYRVTLDQLSIIHPHDIVDDQGLFKFSVLLIEEEKDLSKLVVLIQERVVAFDLMKFEFKIIHGTIQRYPGSPCLVTVQDLNEGQGDKDMKHPAHIWEVCGWEKDRDGRRRLEVIELYLESSFAKMKGSRVGTQLRSSW